MDSSLICPTFSSHTCPMPPEPYKISPTTPTLTCALVGLHGVGHADTYGAALSDMRSPSPTRDRGSHRCGRFRKVTCLCIKRLDDIDDDVLRRVVARSVELARGWSA